MSPEGFMVVSKQAFKGNEEEVIQYLRKEPSRAMGILNTNVPWSECMSGILRTATKL